MVHIGQLIKEELQKQGRTVTWFAKEMTCSRSNAYKIFEKPSIDTATLTQISLLIDVDFFLYFSNDFRMRKRRMN